MNQSLQTNKSFLLRELAFKVLFQLEFNNGDDENREFYENLAIDTVINNYEITVTDGGEKIKKSDRVYINQVVKGTMAKLNEIDEIISTHLKKGWVLQRLATVDRNILRLSIYEIKFLEKADPVNIIINEAVEMAKKYGTDSSSRFVNGLLGAILK